MRRSLAAVLLLAVPLAFAQLAPVDPDWKEIDAPPPPVLRTDRLIGVAIPRSELRFGVDPASISVGADGVVRYVIVAASSSGTLNAMYEGIRCSTAEVKVYARHNPGTGWKPVANADWRSLHNGPQRHSLAIAREGACMGHGANGSAPQIVRDLSSGVDRQFRTDSAR